MDQSILAEVRKSLRTLYVCRNLRMEELKSRGTENEKDAGAALIKFFKDVGQTFNETMTIGQNIGTIFYR